MNEIIFTDANFETEVLKSDKITLVDFYADWCGPCKMQGPIIDEVAKEAGDKFKIGKLDVDNSSETAQKFDVMSIPTIIIFKGGEPVQKFIGLQTKEGLLGELAKLAQ